jgi:E3 ubiquitin-protein ligase UBR2
MHGNVVAHQTFAQRLIIWLQNIIDYSASFRALLGSILLESPAPTGATSSSTKITRLDNFLRHDTILWKAARTSVHHFLISSMLLGNDRNRRSFASTFTKAYGHMMKEFITDDHDHSFSVTSLSVQLFTVPTLAHYLIAHQDVLAMLLRTFMSECERKRNERGM